MHLIDEFVETERRTIRPVRGPIDPTLLRVGLPIVRGFQPCVVVVQAGQYGLEPFSVRPVSELGPRGRGVGDRGLSLASVFGLTQNRRIQAKNGLADAEILAGADREFFQGLAVEIDRVASTGQPPDTKAVFLQHQISVFARDPQVPRH